MNLFAPKFQRTRFPTLRRVLWDGVLIELEDAEKQALEAESFGTESYTDYLQGLRGVGEVFDRHSGGGGGCE